MIQRILQVLYAFLGAYGFALIFNQKPVARALPAALGGALSWSAYLLAEHFGFSVFLSALVAAFCACVYAELLARSLKAPATVFSAAAVIPLIPGGSLFYTAQSAINGDRAGFVSYGLSTLEMALGIAVGFAAVTAIFFIYAKIALGFKNKSKTGGRKK